MHKHYVPATAPCIPTLFFIIVINHHPIIRHQQVINKSSSIKSTQASSHQAIKHQASRFTIEAMYHSFGLVFKMLLVFCCFDLPFLV